MSAANTLERGLLELILNNLNTYVANIGDATGLRGSSTAGSLYLSLHTADPGDTGDQTTSEVAYTSYARVALARDGSKWTVASDGTGVATGVQSSFPAGTGGSGTATYFGVGTASSGAGVLLFSGAISPGIVCGNGVTPRVTPTITCD